MTPPGQLSINLRPQPGFVDPVPSVYGDAGALPFQSGSFDAVTFNHFPANAVNADIFSEAARVLQPGGTIEFSSGPMLDLEQTIKYMQDAGFMTNSVPGGPLNLPYIYGVLGYR